MARDELLTRTKRLGLMVIRLCQALPKTPEARVIQYQILKSATSVGANYRAAKRARSLADFISKMGIVEEEADETMYWLEMIVEAGMMDKKQVSQLYAESGEILAMTVASIKTAKVSRRPQRT